MRVETEALSKPNSRFVEMLSTAVPELEFPPDFDHYELAYVVYEDVLIPHLARLLVDPDTHEKEIARIMQLVEAIAELGDEDAIDFVMVAVCEAIMHMPHNLRDQANSRIGPRTSALMERAKAEFGLPE